MAKNKIRFVAPRAVMWKLWTTLLVLFTIPPVVAEDWPRFRGPHGDGVSAARDVPTEWSRTRNIAWRTEIAGTGWSSPIVVRDMIFVTSAVATDKKLSRNPDVNETAGVAPAVATSGVSYRALCLDKSTGTVRWDKELFRQSVDEVASVHAKNSYASATPCADGDQLYVHFGPVGTASLDFDGTTIWSTQQFNFDARHGSGGSPIVVDGLLVFNCDGVTDPFVLAVDKATGQEVWRAARPSMEIERFSFTTPLAIKVNGQTQIVSAGARYVFAYDPEHGTELWNVHYPQKWSVVPSPVFANGLVFACTGYDGPADLLAIQPNGQLDVTETHVAWRTRKNVPHTPSVLVAGELLFMVSDNGIASCYSAVTGERHWQSRLVGNFSASPVCADDKVYFVSEEGKCTVISAAAEFAKLSENDLNEPVLASFAVSDKAIFVRTSEALYCVKSMN